MSKAQPSLETSFAQLFGVQMSDLPLVHRIEIPLIQRDYAQGRPGEEVARIRGNFLDTLFNALKPGGTDIKLDFIYGYLEKGAFFPLDGQQRLTTLFLLHWYLAWRAGVSTNNQPWSNFSYATRPSARTYCKCLAEFSPPVAEIRGETMLSNWITDQPWYLYTWEHDPTIQSTLVVLDELHRRFLELSDEDCKAAWQRLTDPLQPGISFHLLPMPVNGLADDLYIKMNSRGKPLTPFEHFKAHFEEVLKTAHPVEKAKQFADKVDTEWSNTLWHYRGDDNLIDDEFMRYFRCVTEICAWLSGVPFSDRSRTDDLAEEVYGKDNTNAAIHLEFLFKAFDVWHQKDIKAEFERLFTATPIEASAPLIIFNSFKNVAENESPVDFFASCCRVYGKLEWTLAHTLMLYAVLLNQIHDTIHFPRQLRILRNLIESSGGGEIRDTQMHELLADVKRIVVEGTLRGIAAFNKSQIDNESDKALLLEKQPSLQTALYRLEDHRLLRGCLAAIELDPSTDPSIFMRRADSFHALFDNSDFWLDLTGALLAIGDYSPQQDRFTGYHFSDYGVSKGETPWRELFRRHEDRRFLTGLMSLFDEFAAADKNVACLKAIQESFLRQCETKRMLEWRYYFVKYPAMREGASGRYAISPSGYSACMLNNRSMRGNYRDPYLLVMSMVSGVAEAVVEPWFSGYETETRRLELKKSGICIQCVDKGWLISKEPADPTSKAAFDQVCSRYGIGQSGVFAVPQNNNVDTDDRLILGANVLRDFVGLGL
jgi:hypothetical protein